MGDLRGNPFSEHGNHAAAARRWLVPGAREATAMPRAGGPWRAALTRPKARSGWISMQCAVGRVLSQFSFEAIEVCSLSVTYDAKGGRATMAVSLGVPISRRRSFGTGDTGGDDRSTGVCARTLGTVRH